MAQQAAAAKLLGFPRLYAAASLKRDIPPSQGGEQRRFSAALCRGLIEASPRAREQALEHVMFSAALCRGLIEAGIWPTRSTGIPRCFPRLYAAASLKQLRQLSGRLRRQPFSAALCRGLIEARWPARSRRPGGRFSAALCRGLIEAPPAPAPRSSAARTFSAALCRGLIEAPTSTSWCVIRTPGFPRLYAAASLKLRPGQRRRHLALAVFRGFMPRPH